MAVRLHALLVGFAAIALVVAGAVHTHAQRPRRGGEKIPLNATGTLHAVAPGKIIIKGAGDEGWIININKQTEIHVLGTAEREFLRPGMFIKFQAAIDQKGRVQQPVDKLMIFTPSEAIIPGIFPAQGAAAFGDVGGPAAGGGGGQQPAISNYDVAGQIRNIDKRSQMTVFCGPTGTVTAELGQSPEIEVDVADLRLAKQGDKVTVSGFMTGEHMGNARLVEVELSQPLAPPEDQKKKKRLARQRRDRDEEDDEPNEDEEPAADDEKEADDAQAEEDEDGQANDAPEAGAAAGGGDYQKLATLLKPDAAEAAGKPTFDVPLGPNKRVSFGPSVKGPAETLKKRFGEPTKTISFAQVMGEKVDAGKLQGWELWIWGPVYLVVDNRGNARYFAVDQ